MIVPSGITTKHNSVKPYIEHVAERVRDIVLTYCNRFGFAYLGRAKSIHSTAEKIETGRFKKWTDLDDLFACSIIIPTLADEPAVLEKLKADFIVNTVKERGQTQKDPALFRFDATRVIGKIRPDDNSAVNSALLDVKFEVQVRTAFEHAWSAATHALTYKGKRVDWRRLRLAAQLKASVEQLDQLVAGFDYNATTIHAQTWPEIEARQKIDLEFERFVAEGLIPVEAHPESWVRFGENLYTVMKGSKEKKERLQIDIEELGKTIGYVETELRSNSGYPRSLSLLQFCIGAFTKHGHIQRPLQRYTPLITQELLSLYPSARVLGKGFDLELNP